MATRIDFLEHGGSTHYEYNSIACGYCSAQPKEVLRKLAPKFRVASYRDRSLRPSVPYLWFKSIAIYDINNEKSNTKERFFDDGWRIIKPRIIAVNIEPLPMDQLLEEIEKEIGRWQYDDFHIISPARKLKDVYGYKDDKIKDMIKRDKRTFAFEELARDYMKTIIERSTKFKKASLTTIINTLLNDKPIRELCEVFLRKDNLEQEILERYIIDNRLYKK